MTMIRRTFSATVVLLGLMAGEGWAQQAFDQDLGVDPATRETTEVVPDAKAAAGLEPAAGGGASTPGAGTTSLGAGGAATGGEAYETPASPTTAATDAARAKIWN